MNRYTITMDWIANLAKMGLRDNTLTLKVPHEEWLHWLHDTSLLKRYEVVYDSGSLIVYGPAGIIVDVQQK